VDTSIPVSVIPEIDGFVCIRTTTNVSIITFG